MTDDPLSQTQRIHVDNYTRYCRGRFEEIAEMFTVVHSDIREVSKDTKQVLSILTIGNGSPAVTTQVAINRNSVRGVLALCFVIMVALIGVWINSL